MCACTWHGTVVSVYVGADHPLVIVCVGPAHPLIGCVSERFIRLCAYDGAAHPLTCVSVWL
jgi:hypothetical protein